MPVNRYGVATDSATDKAAHGDHGHREGLVPPGHHGPCPVCHMMPGSGLVGMGGQGAERGPGKLFHRVPAHHGSGTGTVPVT